MTASGGPHEGFQMQGPQGPAAPPPGWLPPTASGEPHADLLQMLHVCLVSLCLHDLPAHQGAAEDQVWTCKRCCDICQVDWSWHVSAATAMTLHTFHVIWLCLVTATSDVCA